MPRISIHPASALLGIVFAVLILVSMSQTPPLNARTVNVQYLPDPRDYVQIREGVPFTVPAGKLFVLTALGSTYAMNSGSVTTLQVNRQGEVSAVGVDAFNGESGAASDVTSLAGTPQGMTVPAGSTVEPLCVATGSGRAWGYLAPQ